MVSLSLVVQLTPSMAMKTAYETKQGIMIQGTAEEVFQSSVAEPFLHKIDLILTSPPFPLNRKKSTVISKGRNISIGYRALLLFFALF
jgi:16S rRNA G1207 methylase RsmC